jgi:hypothetical protein
MPDRKTHQQRPAANRNNSQPKYLQEYGYSYKKQQEKPSLQDIAMIQFSIEDDGKSLVVCVDSWRGFWDWGEVPYRWSPQLYGGTKDRDWRWGAVEVGNLLWRAASPAKTRKICLHRFLIAEDGESFTKNPGRAVVAGHNDPIVHPFALAARGHYAGTAQVRKVARDFGLALPEYLNEITDADLALAYQVEQAQAGAVRERGKQERQVVVLRRTIHSSIIYALTDMSSGEYIRFSVCEETRRWIPKPMFRNR